MQQDDFIGASVTMPNKKAVASLIHELTEEARIIGAVNTIFVRKREITGSLRRTAFVGTNTDWKGMKEALLKKSTGLIELLRKRPAVVIGGGATTRSAVYTLTEGLGASAVYLINRDKGEVDDVIRGLKSSGLKADLKHLEATEQVLEFTSAPVVIISSVPDIPPQTESEKQARAMLEALLKLLNKDGRRAAADKTKVFLEMCYDPSPRTDSVKLAEKEGWDIVDGIDVIEFGAIEQDALWCERPLVNLPLEEAGNAIRSVITRREKL